MQCSAVQCAAPERDRNAVPERYHHFGVWLQALRGILRPANAKVPRAPSDEPFISAAITKLRSRYGSQIRRSRHPPSKQSCRRSPLTGTRVPRVTGQGHPFGEGEMRAVRDRDAGSGRRGLSGSSSPAQAPSPPNVELIHAAPNANATARRVPRTSRTQQRQCLRRSRNLPDSDRKADPDPDRSDPQTSDELVRSSLLSTAST